MSVVSRDAPSATDGDAASWSIQPTVGERWRRWRWPLAAVALLVAVAVVLGVVASGQRRGYLDPDGIDATGARAAVRILSSLGVTVIPVRTTDQAVRAVRPDTTLLVTEPALLDDRRLRRLTATGADIILVAPGSAVAGLADGIEATGWVAPASREPGCSLPVALRAGTARSGGSTFTTPEGAVGCYPDDGAGTLLSIREDERTITVLGSADPLTNRYLDEDGNAALILGLLGARSTLVWYRPAMEPATGQGEPLTSLLPAWTGPVALQLLVAAGVAALWRGRRLGPVVTEPLPVVVRSAEAVEGRARLYRHGRTRGHAAAALRTGTAERLRRRLRLPRGASPATMAAAVARRTARPEAEVAALLDGPPPADDESLVRLAHDLDILEQEVLRP